LCAQKKKNYIYIVENVSLIRNKAKTISLHNPPSVAFVDGAKQKRKRFNFLFIIKSVISYLFIYLVFLPTASNKSSSNVTQLSEAFQTNKE
jgi:hypothetical protein